MWSPIVIVFANGLRYVVGYGFVAGSRILDLAEVAPELRRLWAADAAAALQDSRRHWARRRAFRAA